MQLWATLYDYPSLKTCNGLLKYIENCVRLSWGLVNQVKLYQVKTKNFLVDNSIKWQRFNLPIFLYLDTRICN